ncbi:hypothetical protein Ctob_008434 [Chrysochromulina tobinii]|uniref:MATH domain-containing protein n=1 Tax=Chrysochromulina tobinii TaxID=1460289 RepID=A0A0M0LR88_9EUKA|nr:hypothetical protein Ctob_008434 [Chrysochromulina tobinii]|eukprot:KOO53486.1 hypothetical protein Ctob_008434 [Chrysochromulina sp. CCMP291]
MPPAPRPAWTSHAAAEASSAEAGASASQPSPPSATTVAAVAAASGRPSAGDAAAAAIAIDSAELLSIDRALVTLPELRQTCNAIELLRSAAREGPPIHEWKLSGFASQGPAKVASPPFELYGRRWSLLLHPRGCGANAQGTHISAYLRLEHGPACDARVRLAVRNQHSPTLSTFNKPWQWRFDSNGKNRGVSSLLPLSSANVDAGFVVDDTLVLQLWLRPLGVAESRCLPPGAEDGLPAGDTLQPAARRHFHAKLLHHVWLSNSQALAPAGSPAPAASGCAKLSSGAAGGSAVPASAASGSAAAAHSGAEEVIRVLEQLAPSWCSEDPSWATERHRLQLLALNAAAADGHKETLVALLDSGWMHPVQLYLTNLPAAYARYAGPYEQVASPRRFSYGRPVYRSGHCYLFYAEERVGERDGGVAQWVVGREEDLGCTNGWMFVDDDAVSPELIIGDAEGGAEADSPLLLAARGTAGAAPVVQLLAAEGFCDYRALGAAATHTVRIGLLEAALLRHPSFMSLVQDPFAQLARAVERFPKPLGAALSNLLGWFSCSLYRDGSTVGPFGSLSAPCQEAVLWRVAEAVLIPPGSTGSTAPLHLCALNESCLWEWLAQWDLMMRMSDKLESLLCEGMDDADGEAAEGVYRNLALRYAAQLEECCQLLYGDEVAAELGIQSDGVSVERWSCGGQFLVDVIGRWVFGPSFWIKEHLWRLPDGPSRWEAYRGYHNQLRGTELLLPASYMSVDPWLLSLGCFRGSSAASGRESTMIRYCLELMQSHARHLEGAEPDESSKSGKSRAEMSLLEAWKAKCPYINALDLKRGKNRPLYSYMSSVITEGIHAEPSTSTASLPTAHEREAVASADTAEMVKWWRTLSVPQRQRLLGFPVIDLERLVWLTPIWEVLLHKLPELIAGEASASQRVACVNGQVQLGPALVSAPEAAIQAMQQARSRELEWTTEAGEGIEAAKQRMLEQLALSMLQQRMLDCHKRDSQEEDAERMAQLLIAEEEDTSPPPAAAKKGSADVSNEPWQAVGKAAKGSSKSGKASSLTASVTASGTAAVGAGARAGGNGTGSSSPAATAPVHIDPAMVSLLKEMTGAAPKKCEDALRLHNGNADSAALWLLSEAPPPPGGVPPTPESAPARAEAVSPAAPNLPVAEARAASGAGAARRDGGRGGSPDLRIDGISVTASSFGSATFGGAVRPTDGLLLDLRAVDGATGGAKPTGSIPQSSSGTLPSVAVNVHTLPSVTSSGGLSPSAAPPTSAFPAGAPSALAAWPPTRVANLALVAESGGFDGAELMGVVRDTPPGKPYGFISVWHHNVTVFYHYNDVVPSAKELVKRHTAVAFSVASWSQGFKAEKVRPLTPLEQRVGAKDGRLGMLRANVKKWSASTGEGLLQLCAQPCSLPFTATGALAARLAVGSALVCKIDGKGKDLVACMLQLAGPVGADPGSPSKAETAQAAQGLPQGLPSPSSVPSPKQASLPPSPTRGAPAPASPANLSAAGGRTLSTELSSSDDAGAPMPQPALSPSIGTLPASVMGHEAVGAAFEKLEELSRATAELSAREMASTFGRAQAVQAAQAAASASAADDEDDAAAGAVPSLAWPILPPALQDALPASPALPPGMLQPVGGPAPLHGGSSGALGAGGGAGDALSQPLFPSIGSLGGSGLCGGGLGA